MNIKPQESLFENKKVRIVDENIVWVEGKQYISIEKFEELKAIKLNELENINELDPYEIGYIVGKIYTDINDIISILRRK